MKIVEYVITDELGLHARPAGLLVRKAKGLSSDIVVKIEGKQANATKLFEIMGIAAKKGQKMLIEVSGSDEDAEAEAFLEFLEENV